MHSHVLASILGRRGYRGHCSRLWAYIKPMAFSIYSSLSFLIREVVIDINTSTLCRTLLIGIERLKSHQYSQYFSF